MSGAYDRNVNDLFFPSHIAFHPFTRKRKNIIATQTPYPGSMIISHFNLVFCIVCDNLLLLWFIDGYSILWLQGWLPFHYKLKQEQKSSLYLFSSLNIKWLLVIKFKTTKFINAKPLKCPESTP